MTTPVSPLLAAISAALTDIATAIVSFGLISNTAAASIVTAVMGVVSVAFIVANEMHRSTIAKTAGK